MSYSEGVEFIRRIRLHNLNAVDVVAHARLDRSQETISLAGACLDDHFDPAVREIADKACDLEADCDLLGGIPEADSLHPA